MKLEVIIKVNKQSKLIHLTLFREQIVLARDYLPKMLSPE